jgi:hypothetical protein
LSGRGLCDELITRPEESYRLCCVVVCDLETSIIGAPYIYDISSLRVNDLTLILLMWRKWWTNNASKWQMEFNSGFKGLLWMKQTHNLCTDSGVQVCTKTHERCTQNFNFLWFRTVVFTSSKINRSTSGSLFWCQNISDRIIADSMCHWFIGANTDNF